jgi:hypothetical protein
LVIVLKYFIFFYSSAVAVCLWVLSLNADFFLCFRCLASGFGR